MPTTRGDLIRRYQLENLMLIGDDHLEQLSEPAIRQLSHLLDSNEFLIVEGGRRDHAGRFDLCATTLAPKIFNGPISYADEIAPTRIRYGLSQLGLEETSASALTVLSLAAESQQVARDNGILEINVFMQQYLAEHYPSMPTAHLPLPEAYELARETISKGVDITSAQFLWTEYRSRMRDELVYIPLARRAKSIGQLGAFVLGADHVPFISDRLGGKKALDPYWLERGFQSEERRGAIGALYGSPATLPPWAEFVERAGAYYLMTLHSLDPLKFSE